METQKKETKKQKQSLLLRIKKCPVISFAKQPKYSIQDNLTPPEVLITEIKKKSLSVVTQSLKTSFGFVDFRELLFIKTIQLKWKKLNKFDLKRKSNWNRLTFAFQLDFLLKSFLNHMGNSPPSPMVGVRVPHCEPLSRREIWIFLS